MIILIALALALDAFAVTVGLGANQNGLSRRASLRLAFHFGLFQFLMPILGWQAGEKLVNLIKNFDHWVAFFILWFIGGRMILSGLRKRKERSQAKDLTRGLALLGLSIATSLDALAVGFTLATMEINIIWAAVIIGVVAFGLTMIGAGLSPYLGQLPGKSAEVLGGLILLGIGLRILISHLG